MKISKLIKQSLDFYEMFALVILLVPILYAAITTTSFLYIFIFLGLLRATWRQVKVVTSSLYEH